MIMKSFGSNVREYRKLKNLSQQQLGELLGFSARTVSDWECGNTEPDIKTIKLLSKVLDIPIEYLFDF